MNDRVRLAADLDSAWDEWVQDDSEDALVVPFHPFAADRLIALGWGKNMVADDAAYAAGREDGLAEGLDEERLARALMDDRDMDGSDLYGACIDYIAGYKPPDVALRNMAAAIAKAYREDTDD